MLLTPLAAWPTHMGDATTFHPGSQSLVFNYVKAVWDASQMANTTSTVGSVPRDALLDLDAQPLTPRPYQLDAIQHLAQGNLLLGDEPRMGKTLEVIEAAHQVQQGPALVICNKPAMADWADTIERQIPTATPRIAGTAGRVNLTNLQRAFRPKRDPNIWYIVHWEGLRLNWQTLARPFWDIIIADEAHRICNRKSQTALKLKLITARRKWAVTASYQEQSIADAWSILNWLYPTRYRSYWQFAETLTDMAIEGFGRRTLGTKSDPTTIQQIQQLPILARRRQDVMHDLPPQTVSRRVVDLYPEQRALYTKLIQGQLTLPNEPNEYLSPSNAIAKLIRLQQLASDPSILGYDVPSIKVDWVLDWCLNNPHEPVVILTKFRHTAIRLAQQLDAALIIGSMPTSAPGVAEFKTGKRLRLVGTIDAAGESITLDRSDVLILMDRHWSAKKMAQATDRIYSMTATEPKDVYYLYAKQTVDVLIHSAIQNKWDDATMVRKFLDGGPDTND